MRRLEELIEKRTTSEEETDLGYRSILVSLMARFCLDIRDTEKAVGYLQDYKALAIKIGDNISEHPEVLASKADSFSLSMNSFALARLSLSLFF